MSLQNKIALGLAALGGANAAMGQEAQAQIVDVTLPTNVFSLQPYSTRTADHAYTFGPSGQFYISYGLQSTAGSYVAGYLRGSSNKPELMQFVASGLTNQALTYSAAYIISNHINSGEFWKSNSAIFRPSKFSSLSTGSGNLYFPFRVSLAPGSWDYGWIELHSQTNKSSFTLSAVGLAYAENNAPIYPGQTSAGGTDVPEPASAALLAMGAMTLGARGVRRMKRAKAA